jgi:hypothetical protein
MPFPALMLAVLLVAVLSACGSETPDPPTTPAPSVAQPKDLVLEIRKLPHGDAPKIAWASGTLLNGDESMDVLPAGLDQFAQTKQLLVMRDVDGQVFAYAPEGPTSTTPIGEATGDLAINAERNMVAWIAPDGSPTVLQEGHAKPVTLPAPEGGIDGGDAVAVLGHDCFNGPETVEGAGCSVVFRARGEKARSFVASNHGFVEPVDAIKGVQDADDDAMIGWTTLVDDMPACSALKASNGEQGKPGWKTCDHLPLEFSPDGTRVLATQPEGFEGAGAGELTVVDRKTGKPQLTLKNDAASQAFIVQMAWEDDDHVLAVVNQGIDWAIVRVALDGSMEYAGDPVRPAKELDHLPFHLAVQP